MDGNSGRNSRLKLEAIADSEATEECCLLVCSPLLAQSAVSYKEEQWAGPSYINHNQKVPHRLSFLQVNLQGHLLSLASLFSGDPSLCKLRNKQTDQPKYMLIHFFPRNYSKQILLDLLCQQGDLDTEVKNKSKELAGSQVLCKLYLEFKLILAFSQKPHFKSYLVLLNTVV